MRIVVKFVHVTCNFNILVYFPDKIRSLSSSPSREFMTCSLIVSVCFNKPLSSSDNGKK